MAVIANVALTNTFDTWRTRTNVGFTRLNAFAIDESKLFANTLTANVRFVSTGATRLGTTGTNRTIVNGLLSANGNLNVSGNTTLGGASKTLTIGGSGATVNTTGWFGVTGRASISTNLFVAGNTTIGGALNINGAINLGDASTDLLNVTGRATIAQNLNVSGNTTLGASGKTVNITGTANTTGWFGVNGRATVGTNLFVGGNTTLNGTTTDKSNALSQTLTDQATITWDVASGRVATVTLGASRTIAAPTNQKVGTYILRVIQGGSGSYTLTWNGNFKWTAQTAPVLSTAVGAVDIITFFSDGTKMYGSYLPDMR
jgi:hypothetical protein